MAPSCIPYLKEVHNGLCKRQKEKEKEEKEETITHESTRT